MNKLNYTLKEKEIQEIKQNQKKIKEKILREFEKRKLFKRRRVLKSYSILLKAIFLYIVDRLSFQRISDRMACSKYRICMSDNSWRNQINKAAPIFFSIAMGFLEEKNNKRFKKSKTIFCCSKIYALDATSISAERKNKDVFRLHTLYSLNNQMPCDVDITDIHSAESVKHFPIESNALFFADRAYAKTTQFADMIKNKANFIFRMSPNNVRLFFDEECKRKIDFTKVVRKRNYSIICYFKFQNIVYQIRVIMSPIPVEKHELIEKKTRRKSEKRQQKISNNTILFSKWLFLSTNLPLKVKSKDILNAYRNRWQIELFFKRAKSLLNFHRLKRSSDKYMISMLKLWFAVAALVSLISADIFYSLSSNISLFNLFDLVSSLFS